MATKEPRKSFWDASRRAAYDEEHTQARTDLIDQREGRPLADHLEEHWPLLSEEEAAFVEYLVLIERRVVLTPDAEPLIDRLVEKGFLKPPPGVGALSRRYNQTAYAVPLALWKALSAPQGRRLFAGNKTSPASRQRDLEERFSGRLSAMLHNETGFIDLPSL